MSYLITTLYHLYSYQQTEQSDDALVGDPHHEGRVVRGETPEL